MTQSNFQSNTWLLVIPFWTFLIINMNRDISQSNSKSKYLGSPSYHCSDIKWLPRNNPIQFPIKYVDLPLWQFLIINVSRISQPNSKSQYVGSPSYHRHHIQSSSGKPIWFQIKYMDLPLWTFLSKNISQSRKQQRGNDPIQYKYIPLWTFFIINMSRDVSQSNS